MKWLVSGATGFLGHALIEHLRTQNSDVRGLARRKSNDGNLFVPNDWNNIDLLAKTMEGRDVFVHCAGLAHGKSGDMWAANYDLTINLANAALKAKLRHFIFISSASVLGQKGRFSIQDQPNPYNDYGLSKLKAEQDLYRLFKDSDTKLSIIRPPMIVGPDAPGHAKTLRKLFKRNIPLPCGALSAKRSYVTRNDLIQKITSIAAVHKSVLYHPVSDTISAASLIRLIGKQDSLNPILFWVPPFIFKVLMIMPQLRTKLAPLIHDHIMKDEQISLNI